MSRIPRCAIRRTARTLDDVTTAERQPPTPRAGHRRHRLHRRPPRPGVARRRIHRSRPGPHASTTARPAVGRSTSRSSQGDAADADDVSTRHCATSMSPTTCCTRSSRVKDSKTSSRPWPQTFADAASAPTSTASSTSVGWHPPTIELSPHLASRLHVGEMLRDSGVPTAELRAAVIIGSGSASFEMLRYLTERLPAMVTPRWVRNRIQPIAIRDVLRYLVAAPTCPPDVNRGVRHRRARRPDVRADDAALRRGCRPAQAHHRPRSSADARPCPVTGSASSPRSPRRSRVRLSHRCEHEVVLPRTRHRRLRSRSTRRTHRHSTERSSSRFVASRTPMSRPAGRTPPSAALRAIRFRPTPTGLADRSTTDERERETDGIRRSLWR